MKHHSHIGSLRLFPGIDRVMLVMAYFWQAGVDSAD
jgi:hypothetical protein